MGKTENDADKYQNVIEDYETAKNIFTVEYIFIRDKFRENTESELLTAEKDGTENQRKQSRESFRNLYDVVKERWEARARDFVEQQPGNRQILIDALWKYYSIPYGGLDNSFQLWCSASTLHKWVILIGGYSM